jgi:parallel beta-helix repeat protein
MVRFVLALCIAGALTATFVCIKRVFSASMTFTVTNTGDNGGVDPAVGAGTGTLRQAIVDANANSGADMISFQITGAGVKTITLSAPLPPITSPVTIDGYTQMGAMANTNAFGQADNAVILIELDGTSLSAGSTTLLNSGFRINAGGGPTTIKGLAIYGFGDAGVAINPATSSFTADSNIIAGNFIGTNAAGTVAKGIGSGVAINNSVSNTVGGSDPAARNIISAHKDGGVIINELFGSSRSSSRNTVQGNYIGTDVTGAIALQNAVAVGSGVTVNGTGFSNNTQGNVISGNSGGISLLSVNANGGNTVQGNRIGTTADGNGALANNGFGVSISAGQFHTISGNLIANSRNNGLIIGSSTHDNIITTNTFTGNRLAGISLGGDANRVSGNTITNSQTLPPPSDATTGQGINVTTSASFNEISSNSIHDNGGEGILISGLAASIHVLGNTIYSNGRLGIDLSPQGVTPNDAGDTDNGPNHTQNFPVITAASTIGSTTTIKGTLNSNANKSYIIEFFSSPACNGTMPNDFGEGQVYLGSLNNVMTDANGNSPTFTFTPTSAVTVGHVISATATNSAGDIDLAETSEFSECFTVIQGCSITCPASPMVTTTGCSAVVSYGAPNVTGGCTPSCSPTSGSSFPVGTTTVTCSVTDAGGVQQTCNFTVTVTESTPPTVTCPSNIIQSAEMGQCSAAVTFTATASDNCDGALTPTCNPASGSRFQKGTTTVTCTATDRSNNQGSCNFTVAINDTQAPVLNGCTNVSANTDTNACSKAVTYTPPTANDNCDNSRTVTCDPASGSTFQKGTTTVSCSASDLSNNTGTCSFTVTVTDNVKPTLTCPANITHGTDANKCSAVISYTTPAGSDNCPGVTVACVPASGSTFQKGTTTVTCTATDTSNNTATCSFTALVNDTQNPTVSCPSDITFTTPGPSDTCGTVTFTTPTGSDNCTLPPNAVVCSPASGTCFAVGITTVTCTVTDGAGLTGNCNFKVTVQNPCTLTCPASITKGNDRDQCGAVASFSPTTTGACGTVTCAPASGSFFPKGTTTVICSTQAGTSCSFTVTVNDTQLPTIACPANLTKGTDANLCTAVVSYDPPQVSDNCSGVGTPACTPPSGTAFSKGTTTVSCSVTDASSNTARCSFTVMVNDTQPPAINCPANISRSTDPNLCTAVVTYNAPAVNDNCPGVGMPSCTPASGTAFAKGVTTVTCSVTDAAKNSSSCNFTVAVNDTQMPSIVCPASISKHTDADLCTAVVNYAAPQIADNCPGVTAICMPPSGSAFPKGVTTVSCTATDSSNNQAGCSFTVTVNDQQPPSFVNGCSAVTAVAPLTCPISTTQTVSYALPQISDNCPGATVACVPPSGSVFAVGTVSVTCTATDASGNTATCSFAVTVWTACLQDESNPGNVCLFDAQTGKYQFCCNGVVIATGTGTATVRGCIIAISQVKGDRRVQMTADLSSKRGSAMLQIVGATTCAVTDTNMTNNTCQCPLPPPAKP